MAKVIPIGEPVNDAERLAIAHLRDHLPESFTILHNFEIRRGQEHFEIDLAVLAPHAVYLVDVKGTRGTVHVYGAKWYPEGRQAFASPVAKLRNHARVVKGIITSSAPSRSGLGKIYVGEVVLLTAPDAYLDDPDGRDAGSVTTLATCDAFFRDTQRVPDRFSGGIKPFHSLILKTIQGRARPKSEPTQYQSWVVTERVGATDLYAEYRAHNAFAGEKAGTVLLRLYRADPNLPEEERKDQAARISNGYRALSQLPSYPAILGARDFFSTEDGDGYVLVTDDAPGQPLRLHIKRSNLALTFDQKFRVARDLLGALAHAHLHGVLHRNITPGTVLVGADGQTRLTSFDFARSGADRSRTVAHAIVDELEPEYQAPECYREPLAASPVSDVFSAGVVLYELFVGERPF